MGMVDLLFSFNGRINRAQYWSAGIAVGFVAVLVVAALFLMTGLSWGSSQEEMVRAAMGFLLALVPVFGMLIWINTALQVKRFHDRGQSGFWALLPWGVNALIGFGLVFLIPISWLIGLALLVHLGFLPGVEGENRFGPPPGSPGAYTPKAPRPAGASTMLGAEAAMERALAEQKLRANAPAPARPAPTARAAAPSQPSFGRRVVQ